MREPHRQKKSQPLFLTAHPHACRTKGTFTPDNAPPSADTTAPSLYTAVQEQLGLKLDPAKAPMPVLVVDHIDQPTPD